MFAGVSKNWYCPGSIVSSQMGKAYRFLALPYQKQSQPSAPKVWMLNSPLTSGPLKKGGSNAA